VGPGGRARSPGSSSPEIPARADPGGGPLARRTTRGGKVCYPLERLDRSSPGSAGAPPDALFEGAGEARARARALDWRSTPLGAAEAWPEALRVAARLCLDSPTAIAIWAGPEFTLIHNDAYVPFLGAKGGWAMGRPAREVWEEVWDRLGPEFAGVLQTGVATHHVDAPFVIRRHGRDETGWFTFTLSPVRAGDGRILALLNVCQETTAAVQAAARLDAELRASEDTARRQLAEIQSIYDSARVGLCVLDRELRFVRINRRLAELNGVPVEGHLGRTVEEIVPTLAPTARDIARRVFATGVGVTDVELKGQTPSMPGVERTWVEQWLPLHDASGAVTGLNVVVDEVTEQRRAEEALRQDERRLAAMFRRSPVAMAWMRFPQGVFVDVNDAWTALIGIPREEAVGKTSAELGMLADVERRGYYASLSSDGAAHAEVELTTRRGPRTALVKGEVVTLGAEQFVLAVLQDVTELRRAERELRDKHARLEQERARLQAILDTIPAGLFIVEASGKVAVTNEEARRIWAGAVPLERLADYGEYVGYWPDTGERLRPEEWPAAQALLHGRRTKGCVVDIERFDGTRGTIVFSGAPIQDEAGHTTGAVVAIQDISDLRAAQARLEESDRRKTEFIALLSHELRNPLAPIRNSIALLDGAPPGSPVATRAREILRRQTDHLVRLVDDLLDVNRITHGKIQVQLAPADLRELVRRAFQDARGLFDARGIELLLSEPAEPLWVAADAERFAQMVGNLLHNALKFTPAGGRVELSIVRAGAACEVHVKDSGRGIEPADLERIFEPFHQSRRSRESGGGLGLGLALVKGLAERHGGSVRAVSDLSTGAELVLSLPLAPPPAAVAGVSAPPPEGAALRILIVEDNEDAAASLADLLALGGHDVTIAATGGAGVAGALSRAPDLLICDVGLPDMSGHDVIRAIRARDAGARVFATALTGYAQPHDREAALAAGFDAHLPKPPPLEELDAVLAEAARRRRAPAR